MLNGFQPFGSFYACIRKLCIRAAQVSRDNQKTKKCFFQGVMLFSFTLLKELVDDFFQIFLGECSADSPGLGVAFEED